MYSGVKLLERRKISASSREETSPMPNSEILVGLEGDFSMSVSVGLVSAILLFNWRLVVVDSKGVVGGAGVLRR